MRISIIQEAAIWNSKEKSIKLAVQYIHHSAQENQSELIVFGESWLTGYPAWLDCGRDVAIWDSTVVKDIYKEMWINSIDIASNDLQPICEAANEHNVWICLGLNEKVTAGPGNGSLYNSLVFINNSGEVVHHHRKLMPTYTERLVHAQGDSRGLKTAEINTDIKLGALICWEHWMPLTRQALHLAGETIHIALWPKVHEMHQIASRHYAFEGRCFVIAVGQILKASGLPQTLEYRKDLIPNKEHLVLNGQSAVIGPDGKYLLPPQGPKHKVIHFTIEDMSAVVAEKMSLDVTGHYNRPDIFDFNVKR